jgi:hypothetical protein
VGTAAEQYGAEGILHLGAVSAAEALCQMAGSMAGTISHKLQAPSGYAAGLWGDGDCAWGSNLQVEQSRGGLEQLSVHSLCSEWQCKADSWFQELKIFLMTGFQLHMIAQVNLSSDFQELDLRKDPQQACIKHVHPECT